MRNLNTKLQYKLETNFDNSVCYFSNKKDAEIDIRQQMIDTIEDGIITKKINDFKITKI